jgi:membrane-bound serine protease (ClpP class)
MHRRLGQPRLKLGAGHAALIVACLLVGPLLAHTPTAQPPIQSAPVAVPAYRQADHVAVLRVEGEIDTMTLRSLERRMAEAKAIGATAVVLDLNTPGGDANVTRDICNLIKDRSETPANVVAWVNPNAYSAGTYMALACREIVVDPNATMGDAAPIAFDQLMGLQPIPPAERAKIEAPYLAEVIDSARRNHYDENLVQAFVSVGVELWLIENTETGERAFATREEYIRVFDEEPPNEFISVTPRASRVMPRFAESEGDAGVIGDPAMSAEAIHAEIESLQDLPSSRRGLTENDRGKWKLVTQVISDDRLLTLKAGEMLHYGLAVRKIANDDELKAYFGAKQLTRMDESWSEQLVRVLINPWVRGLLILLFIVSGVIEMHTPGVGIFGAASLGALLILIGAPALAGMAGWWELVVIGAGIVLVLMELFIIPGFGVAGVAGIGCLLVGIVGTFISGDLRTPQGQEELWTGLGMTFTAIFLAGVSVWFLSRYFESLPLLNRFVLQSDGRSGAAPSRSTGLLAAMGATSGALNLGDVGLAETDLRPIGRASFAGRLVDVQATGSYISRGAPVRVVSVGRFVIEVEEATT